MKCDICGIERERLLRHLKSAHGMTWYDYWLRLSNGVHPLCSSDKCDNKVTYKNSLPELGFSQYCSRSCQASDLTRRRNIDSNPMKDKDTLRRRSITHKATFKKWEEDAVNGDLSKYVENIWRRGANSRGTIVYILAADDKFKVGLTHNVSDRLYRMHKQDENYEIVVEHHCSSNTEAESLERTILQSLGAEKLYSERLEGAMPHGWTETFRIEYLDEAISLINKEK